jgi:flagellar secretion chaperone FliS
MFGNRSNPTAAYQSVSIESSISEADPHKLILLLFEGAEAAIAIAKGEMSRSNIPAKGKAISKALDIIENGLKASLNMDINSDLVEKLDALYEYMIVRLLHANLKNDMAALDEVASLLGEIHRAWAEIRGQVVGQAPAF